MVPVAWAVPVVCYDTHDHGNNVDCDDKHDDNMRDDSMCDDNRHDDNEPYDIPDADEAGGADAVAHRAGEEGRVDAAAPVQIH